MVLCLSCHGAIADCQGGKYCPLATVPVANAQVLSGGRGSIDPGGTIQNGEGQEVPAPTREITSLECSTLLPRSMTRALTKSALDFILTVAKRPSPGTVIEFTSLDLSALIGHVQGGRATASEIIHELVRRIGDERTTAPQATRINSAISALSTLQKTGGSTLVNPLDVRAAEFLGAFTLAWAQVGKIVSVDPAAMALAGVTISEGDLSDKAAVLQSKIIRPKTPSQYFHMLSLWVMVVHATGLANCLVSMAFLLKVVHEPLSLGTHSWEETHESFLLYLEAIETQPANTPSPLTLHTVWFSGSQDSFRLMAQQRAREYFKNRDLGGFRSSQQSVPKTPGERPQGEKTCISFNLSKGCSNPKCGFAHKCDAWVTQQPDGTPGGICGSTKHNRQTCTNPFKSLTKV